MTIKFIDNELIIGSATVPENVTFRFSDILKLGGGGSSPSWQDIVLSGNGSLTLTNAKANGLNYLKLFGGTEQRNVPNGYKELVGISMDSNCLYQITGFKLRGSDTVRISFSIDGACNVFGCYQGTDANDNYDLYVSTTSGSKYLRYGNGTYLSYWSSSKLGQRFNVVFTPTGTTGMPQDSTWTEMTFESANDMLIGSTTLISTSAKLKGSLYGHIIVDGRLELIPVERLSDNEICYYDKVSGTVYEPTGTTPTSLGYATPTPTTPVDIVCNNGVLTFGAGNTYTTANGQGTFVSPVQTTTTRIYKAFGQLQAGKYKVKITGNFEFIFQYKDTMDLTPTTYGNIGTWTTEGEYEITDENMYYGVAIRNAGGSGNIYPSNFNNIGSIGYKYLDVIPVGTTETVEVFGKNLYNASADTVGYAIDANGNIIPASNACYSSAIPVTIGEYTYSGVCSNQGTSNNKRIHGYLNGVWVQQIALIVIPAETAFNYTFTVPSGINEIRISHWNEDTNTQIELGSTATTYEPYFDGGSATAEMLLAIGDNKDEQNVTSGGIIRNIGYVIFDGSETFTASTAYGKACLIQSAASSWGADKNKAVLCTHFLGKPTTTGKREDYTCFFNASGHFYFRLEDNTVATFKQFLADQYNAGTPVIVFFVKAEPTTETVTGQPLHIQAGTNIVEITQASIDNLGLEVSYKAGVAVTVTEVQNAQLDNSVTVTIGE